ncbi:MAG: phage tail protein [Desulfobacteraceae bacterium]|nr:phage tail protein [Desulfobacteraceae bacterium]
MTTSDALRALFAPMERTDRFYGVVIGVVTNNKDPENMHRVKVKFPWLSDDVESNWARVAAAMAGGGRGAYFLPEVDDEVLVAFEHGRVDFPFVIGALWNGKDGTPESNSDGENNHRTIKSRSGHVLRFNDTSGNETIEIIDKSGKNSIIVDTANNSITIEAHSDITVRSSTGKLTLEANGIEMKSQAGISAQAAQSMDLQANAQVTVKGATIHLN